MIDKTELLRMIMETNQGQSPAYILEQYTTYLKGLTDIHGNNFSAQRNLCVQGSECKQEEKMEDKPAKQSITCGWTKRNLKVKPEDAITEDTITCCLCGKEGKTLTERHLNSHNGLTRQGYLKLCGYPETQILMSGKHLARMKNNVLKAQQARKAKKRKEED